MKQIIVQSYKPNYPQKPWLKAAVLTTAAVAALGAAGCQPLATSGYAYTDDPACTTEPTAESAATPDPTDNVLLMGDVAYDPDDEGALLPDGADDTQPTGYVAQEPTNEP